jgi:hypothetical protein
MMPRPRPPAPRLRTLRVARHAGALPSPDPGSFQKVGILQGRRRRSFASDRKFFCY